MESLSDITYSSVPQHNTFAPRVSKQNNRPERRSRLFSAKTIPLPLNPGTIFITQAVSPGTRRRSTPLRCGPPFYRRTPRPLPGASWTQTPDSADTTLHRPEGTVAPRTLRGQGTSGETDVSIVRRQKIKYLSGRTSPLWKELRRTDYSASSRRVVPLVYFACKHQEDTWTDATPLRLTLPLF